jgi:hypothetical protein
MRPAHRFLSFSSTILVVVSSTMFALGALISGSCRAQSAASVQDVPAKGRQTSSIAPTDWDAAVRELVDRVAAISAPPAKISLTVNNVSSLTPDEAAAIGEQLRDEFNKWRFRLTEAPPFDANVIVTLSEVANGYLIVAQVRRAAGEQAEQVAMVSVPKAAKKAERSGGVSLEQVRIWEQGGAILDFALPRATAGEMQEMIVLEPGRLVFYSRPQQEWQIDQAVIIPPARPWLRAERGHLDISQGLAMGSAAIPGIQCGGDFTNPQTIHCGFVSQDTQTWIQGDGAVPKELDIGGDVADAGLKCDGRAIVLATGKGDWTQPDFIQAYERDLAGRAATLTGSPIEFAGPVTALWPNGASGSVRAVVRNLKTGNYEAYVVTASCSH